MSYVLLNLSKVSDAAEEWLSANAFEHGALGVSEALAFEQPEGEEDVFTKTHAERALDVYFARPPAREFLETLSARYPEIEFKMSTEVERDWLAEWKKSFRPFALTGGHWVVPSWCEAPPEAEHKIWIDPGMAFGTGTHETTRLVAHQLRAIAEERPISSVLDVGTGTGILAILARQLGVPKIAATEIEADARRVARENFALNGADHVAMDERQVQDLTETFDVVLANIIDGVLVRIRESLLARVKPGGWLVVSGIITEREPDFLAGFPMTWDVRRQDGDWLLFAARI